MADVARVDALRAFEAQADNMARLAIVRLRVETTPLNPREKRFAETLLRHAKGAQVAAAAWRQELSTS